MIFFTTHNRAEFSVLALLRLIVEGGSMLVTKVNLILSSLLMNERRLLFT